ncbi:hypothetical protein PV10_04341 [Exophiala mesophila]|uniref:DUF1750-domain-containing protein n=1 Tax=Exophiala mesophila TaxID=212818 RepID=A0A0D1WUY2_EXOME|nr:uncharacterized protein PV10_04341 [Exophiala mesophila]KIV93100.1 hypothetical protein PV10_04341 [Exophiala mesophila]
MTQMLKDPAAGLPPQLVPHMHLISKHRYALANNPSFETITNYLLEAPKIVRDLQPMHWQFLDTPQDGTMMLTWQPLEYLATNFASDGYIWADVEVVFKTEVKGYTLEMFMQRSGYRASGEAVASHCRRRYRLVGVNQGVGLPNPDTSLWIVHYSKAASRDHIPSASIPVPPQIQAQVQQRRIIQAQGHLPRKEFMLHDRANWPMIHLPQNLARALGAAPQAVAHRRGGSITQDTPLEDEEDVSRGDLFDFMTPRDISRLRYEQHHEWMEEVVQSPHPIKSIVPSDLGLGRKGVLEDLTRDFFDAPTSALREPSSQPPAAAGKLAAGKAQEFTKRAEAKLAEMRAELEKMKKIHARRVGRMERSTVLNTAEKRLRSAPNTTERRSLSHGSQADVDQNQAQDVLNTIVAEVESVFGKKIEKTSNVTLINRGGLEDRAPSTPAAIDRPSIQSPVKTARSSLPPTTSATVSPSGPSSTAPETESQQPQAIPAPSSTQQPPADKNEPAPTEDKPQVSAQPTPGEPQSHASGDDSNEASTTNDGKDQIETPQVDIAESNGNNSGQEDTNMEGQEWVMIDEDGGQNGDDLELPDVPDVQETRDDQQYSGQSTHQEQSQPAQQAQTQTQAPEQTQVQAPEAVKEPSPRPELAAQTNQSQQNDDNGLDTPDFGIGGDFDNVDVDTAGDALASYGNDEGDDDLNLDGMEDSAFGDAFHPQEDEEMT